MVTSVWCLAVDLPYHIEYRLLYMQQHVLYSQQVSVKRMESVKCALNESTIIK